MLQYSVQKVSPFLWRWKISEAGRLRETGLSLSLEAGKRAARKRIGKATMH